MLWIILILFFLIIELITTQLVSVWFMFGSLVAAVSSIFIDSILIQCIIFILSSIIFLVLTKPFIDKYININKIKTDTEKYIGQESMLIKDIKNNSWGYIKIDNKEYPVISDNNEEISKGTQVVIVGIDGVKFIVKSKKDDQ